MILEFLISFILTFIIFVLIILIPTRALDVRLRTISAMSKLPGPKGLPFIGIAHIIGKLNQNDLIQFWNNLRQDYPRLAAMWVLGAPYAVLFDPDDVETLLGSSVHIKKGFEYDSLKPWLQEGLLISSGEKWHTRRKLLTPAFHFKILHDSLPSLNKHARCLVRNMLKRNGEPIIIEELIVRCTLDTICETAMGYELNLQEDEGSNNDYLKAVRSTCHQVIDKLLKVYYNKEWFYVWTDHGKKFYKNLKYLHGFTEKIIKERKETYYKNLPIKQKPEDEELSGGRKKKAFLDIMIELDRQEGNLFSDKDLREEMDTFMFEGFDTVHAAVVYSLYSLGKHADIQEKVYEEMYEIFGDSDRAATTKDVNEMHYLEMVIKETLRMYPSVPYITRHLTQDLILKDNTVLPAVLNIGIVPYLLHRDPKFYPNPEVFDPERFTIENCKNRHPYAYIPFSAGPRNCIGQKFAMMELKVVLSTIIRFAKIQSVSEEVLLIPTVILRSQKPVQIKVIPR
ncbi:hypothetical protein O3M35_009873 [Rhynocoris fuscipes]|uniref:Cytochrome P450 n=1 Tax=Rhynocoris fuscipes TaxID=488301 RepID=A0AAW1D594_9HEMI